MRAEKRKKKKNCIKIIPFTWMMIESQHFLCVVRSYSVLCHALRRRTFLCLPLNVNRFLDSQMDSFIFCVCVAPARGRTTWNRLFSHRRPSTYFSSHFRLSYLLSFLLLLKWNPTHTLFGPFRLVYVLCVCVSQFIYQHKQSITRKITIPLLNCTVSAFNGHSCIHSVWHWCSTTAFFVHNPQTHSCVRLETPSRVMSIVIVFVLSLLTLSTHTHWTRTQRLLFG